MTKTSKSAVEHFNCLARDYNLPTQAARQMVDIHHHHIERRKQRDRTIFDRWTLGIHQFARAIHRRGRGKVASSNFMMRRMPLVNQESFLRASFLG